MENLTTIVNGTTAKLTHVCSGKVYYQIDTENLTIQRSEITAGGTALTRSNSTDIHQLAVI